MKGDIVIFSYLLVHGSFQNISTKTRKMFLIQLASADDIPISNMHKSPCAGMVLRGKNNHITANLNERHDSASKNGLCSFRIYLRFNFLRNLQKKIKIGMYRDFNSSFASITRKNLYQ